MAVNAFWATTVLLRKDERAMIKFHRFSLVVWVIWLIPVLLRRHHGDEEVKRTDSMSGAGENMRKATTCCGNDRPLQVQ